MTAKTHGYITKEIELEQIYQFVLKYFDPEAKVNRYENRFGESNEMAVYFTYRGKKEDCSQWYIRAVNSPEQGIRQDWYSWIWTTGATA